MTERVALLAGVGAVAGLGAAVAERFAREGFTAVVAARTRENLDTVVARINDHGAKAYAVVADASREEQVVSLIDQAETIGPIHVAVYNAGGNRPSKSLNTSGDFFEQMWRVGTYGDFVFGREAVKRMLPRG